MTEGRPRFSPSIKESPNNESEKNRGRLKDKIVSLANMSSLLNLLTFSHRPAKFASMMKMLLKLILNILLGPPKDSDLVLTARHIHFVFSIDFETH
jgi:hypothetical protein